MDACPRCGTDVGADDEFCSECGQELSEADLDRQPNEVKQGYRDIGHGFRLVAKHFLPLFALMFGGLFVWIGVRDALFPYPFVIRAATAAVLIGAAPIVFHAYIYRRWARPTTLREKMNRDESVQEDFNEVVEDVLAEEETSDSTRT